MPELVLTTGDYRARSVTAALQRCVNLYSEKAPDGEAAKISYYPVPGLTRLSSPPIPGEGRCFYTATNGQLLAVVGNQVYAIAAVNWSWQRLGQINTFTGPAKMQDNGFDVVLVDGSSQSYVINLATLSFQLQVDNTGTGILTGASAVAYLDTYLIYNRPLTQEFYCTLSMSVQFDGTYYAKKNGYPDRLATVVVKHRELWLIGTQSCEVWYNVGGAAFPFERLAGAFLDVGTCAPASVARDSNSLYMLSLNQQGERVALNVEGYDAKRISTHALEVEWQSYVNVSDAWGFTYQQSGHLFWVLNFPSADKTWVYDATEGRWHQRGWTDELGELHRWRVSCHAFAYGRNLGLDYEDGRLYDFDLRNYTFDGTPIRCVRGLPHLRRDGKRVSYVSLTAEVEVGEGLTGAPDPLIELRWSDTRGKTWSNALAQSLGGAGAYQTKVRWTRLGQAVDRVFELAWTTDRPTTLNSIYLELVEAAT